MSATPLRRWLVGGLLLAILLPSATAEAVIPSAFGPIQALIAILPQLLMACAALFVALFKPRTYKLLGRYLWAHKIFTLILVSLPVLLVWAPWGSAGGPVTAEKKGAPWPVLRGGPLRTGVVPGDSGPKGDPTLRRFLPKTGLNVDSSPAVVGNRVYVGTQYRTSGILYCIDAETGGRSWEYDGAGLSPGLGPLFSSPAVWAEGGAARYVVSGEGYHFDKNCRIFCLDLQGGPPKLHWSVQTTSHVESSPCIHDGRVFIGAGDDGFWCVELATGKVLWRLEGGPSYEVTGPQAAALAALDGKTVVATGPVARVGLGEKDKDDSGRLTIEVKSFRDHSGAPLTGMDSGKTFERTVTGKVVKGRIEVADSFPDCESAPVGAGDAVLFGTGLGGPAVVCVDAKTGALRWKTPVPHPAFSPPTVAGDRVLVGLAKGGFLDSDANPAGALVCLSLKDGTLLWTVKTEGSILGAAAVHEGRAYAACRDKHVYVVDVAKGTLLAKHNAGAPMGSSPAVTADTIYVGTGAGKVLGLDRQTGAVRWGHTASPGYAINSSPAVAAGRLFIGTQGNGLHCLSESSGVAKAAGPARPWAGPGGGADRAGAADDLGLPGIEGDISRQKWSPPAALQRAVAGPVIGCGDRVYAAFAEGLACVEPKTGKIAWQAGPARAVVADPDRVYAVSGSELIALEAATGKPLWKSPAPGDALALGGPRLFACNEAFDAASGAKLWSRLDLAPVGAPAPVGSLLLLASKDALHCLDAPTGKTVWRADLAPTGPPTVVRDRIYIACGKQVQARSLLDGSPLWRAELEEAARAPISATDEYVAVPGVEQLFVLQAADGKLKVALLHLVAPRTPVLHGPLMVFSAEPHVTAFDVAKGENVWDCEIVGKGVSAPLLLGRTVWVGSPERGLVAVGAPEKP